jgi:hypothetical protein
MKLWEVTTYLILDIRESGARGGWLQQARVLSAERSPQYRGLLTRAKLRQECLKGHGSSATAKGG